MARHRDGVKHIMHSSGIGDRRDAVVAANVAISNTTALG